MGMLVRFLVSCCGQLKACPLNPPCWIAGSLPDAVLTTCASQIGQILLTLPNAFAKTGLPPTAAMLAECLLVYIQALGFAGLLAGMFLCVGSACMSLWTMQMLITLYLERKQRLVCEMALASCSSKLRRLDASNLPSRHCSPARHGRPSQSLLHTLPVVHVCS